MASEFLGVTFELAKSASGNSELRVVSVTKDTLAVEFIAHIQSIEWASEVLATRLGVTAPIPADIGGALVEIRLFDKIGKEITKGQACVLGSGATGTAKVVVPASPGKSKPLKWLSISAAVVGLSYVAATSTGLLDSPGIGGRSTTRSVEAPTRALAVLSRSANLRSQAAFAKENVVSVLPFGTELTLLGQTAEFLQVQVYGGQSGYIHQDVAGDVMKVRSLGSRDSVAQAKSVIDSRRGAIQDSASRIGYSAANPAVLLDLEPSRLDEISLETTQKIVADDVGGRYFHYLAEEAVAKKNPSDALMYFRASALSNPLSVHDVHGWGITAIRSGLPIDETLAVHAVLLSPKAANSWVIVAATISKSGDTIGQEKSAAALRKALEYSRDREVTKRFFADLTKMPINNTLRAAIASVIAT